MIEWFEAHGVKLKCEEDLRIFPVSDRGSEVIGAFESLYRKYVDRITVHFSTTVKTAAKKDGGFHIQTEQANFSADILVITTG